MKKLLLFLLLIVFKRATFTMQSDDDKASAFALNLNYAAFTANVSMMNALLRINALPDSNDINDLLDNDAKLSLANDNFLLLFLTEFYAGEKQFSQEKDALYLATLEKCLRFIIRNCPQRMLNFKNLSGNMVLHHAVLHGLACEYIEILVARGAPINAQNVDKETPLHYAVKTGHYEAAKVLIHNGADRMLPNWYGEAAWQLASPETSQEIINILRWGDTRECGS